MRREDQRAGAYLRGTLELVAAVLRDEAVSLEPLAHEAVQKAFVEAAIAHEVASLVRRHLKQQGRWSDVPERVKDALDQCARTGAAREALRAREVGRVLSALGEIGTKTLVFKGAGLALTHYPAAYLRPRCDTDLLIPRRDRPLVVDRLEGLGYRRVNSVARELVQAQWTFVRRQGDIAHFFDLHWEVSNRPLFARMFPFDELYGDRVIVASGTGTPSPVHALLLACTHRVAHHDDPLLLLWLYDIRLLAASLTSGDWDRFRDLAERKRVSTLCREGLALAARWVASPVWPAEHTSEPGRVDRQPCEPASAYLGGTGSRLRSLALDVRASKGAAAKMRLLAAHAFPDAQYMRLAFGATSVAGLPLAYLRRALTGVWRLARKHTGPHYSGN